MVSIYTPHTTTCKTRIFSYCCLFNISLAAIFLTYLVLSAQKVLCIAVVYSVLNHNPFFYKHGEKAYKFYRNSCNNIGICRKVSNIVVIRFTKFMYLFWNPERDVFHLSDCKLVLITEYKTCSRTVFMLVSKSIQFCS